jgi:hypothetical protein
MATQYAHEVLANPVKYCETVEKIRRLGLPNAEAQVARAIEASRVLKDRKPDTVRYIVTDYIADGIVPQYYHVEDIPAGATYEFYDNTETLTRRIAQLLGNGFTENIDFGLQWQFRKNGVA